MELTQARALELFDYDAETGALTHGRRRPGRFRRGEQAGRMDRDGYLNVSADGAVYKAHRLAWLMVYGRWPVDELDHINGARDDNRLVNLREASHRENGQNRAVQRNNASGHTGVSWCSRRKKWRAQIASGGKRRDLGRFDSFDAAVAAYRDAKRQLHEFQPVPRMG